jgi:hypothetical protein
MTYFAAIDPGTWGQQTWTLIPLKPSAKRNLSSLQVDPLRCFVTVSGRWPKYEVLNLYLYIYLNLSVYLTGSTRIWTQGLALARQALCHLSHAPNTFCFLGIFWIGSYVYALTGLNHYPIFAFWGVRMIDAHHQTQFYWVKGDFKNFSAEAGFKLPSSWSPPDE